MESTVRSHPAAVIGPRLAADIVRMVREEASIRLDYSPASLSLVDRIIDGIRRGTPPAAVAARALHGFGAYTGEVLVRGSGAVWVDFDAEQRCIFDQAFGIRMPDGRTWNPLGKAVKRYEAGAEHSLRLFQLAVAGGARI